VLALSVLASCKVYVPDSAAHSPKLQFDGYLAFWNKTYSGTERHLRLRNFVVAGERIRELNAASTSATFGYTQFADMDPEEFAQKMLGYSPSRPLGPFPEQKIQANPTVPIDWVAKGKTTPVKNQIQCGSCWVMAAVEAIESANMIAGKPMTIGSSQEVVDCDTKWDGCNGGEPRDAMAWVKQQGGLETEACYPYTGEDGTCYQKNCTPSPNLQISAVIPVAEDELAVYNALAKYGPLAVCVDAETWQYYTGGILAAANCGHSIDHTPELTGYSPNDGGYWIVRNSWGTEWGLKGFLYLQYGHNACGITSSVTGAVA